MKPDRENYEIWLIDWLDGKLDDAQVGRLLLFLDQNPDLKDEFYSCSDVTLTPPLDKFRHKQQLKKEPADITDKQFEYLCAGYVENDLSDEQLEELKKIISVDITRKQELELFKQTKLTSPDIKFGNKRKLLRITPFQKTLRISVAALAAAASIAIFIVAYQFTGKNNLPADNLLQAAVSAEQEPNIIISETDSSETESAIAFLAEETAEVNTIMTSVNQTSKEIVNIETDEENAQDSIFIPFQRDNLNPIEIPNLLSINLSGVKDYQNNFLLPIKTVPDVSDSELHIPVKNLAQIFREKILKKETPDNSPIKAYELAEVGINGLNKLLGWEMDFKTQIDENGKVKIIYFSSRRFYAQIPVNKSE